MIDTPRILRVPRRARSPVMGKTRHHYYASPSYEEDQTEHHDDSLVRSLEPTQTQWHDDCHYWRGLVLVGRYAHWCPTWNYLPMDETCPEWPCGCGIEQVVERE